MSRPHVCRDRSGCGYCETRIEARENRDEQHEMSDREWDRWEQGPGWNFAPGMEPRWAE
jgi:ferredoxin